MITIKISGPAASGKTMISNKIQELMSEKTVEFHDTPLSEDAISEARERGVDVLIIEELN